MKVKKRGLFAVLFLICLLGLVGCGGGSNSKTTPPDTTPPTTTLTLKSEAGLDGHIAHWFTDPEMYGIGNAVTVIQLGQAVTGGTSKIADRGFVSFNLSSLPAGATIKSAILRVYQSSSTGNPYDKLENIFVDHISHDSFAHTAEVANVQTLYQMSALDSTIPADSFLSTDTTVGYKTLDVKAAVQADQAASRGHAQYKPIKKVGVLE